MRPASPASASKPASASQGASAGGTSNSALTSARAGPFAHDAGVAAAAERELERVDEDRLAGAGLAAQHRQARRELDLERVDDDEVADRETVQHAPDPRGSDGLPQTPDAQCSLPRSVA